jgi:beta-lactamase regulating signal transducer with metallopeptidase domain
VNVLVLESLAWALVHLLWQGALVAVVLAVALRVLGRRAATARYALACGALLILLALPVATGWRHYSAASARGEDVSFMASRAEMPSPREQTAMNLPTARHSSETVATATLSTRVSALESRLERWLALIGKHLSWLVLAWGVGVAVSSLRLLAGWLRLRRQVSAALAAPLEWQERLNGLARKLGLKRAVRLLESAALEVPSAVGWLRPIVLLPTSALTGLSTRQLEMILAHELAHILRYDFAVNLAQTLVETLLFYHPAVWWISHVIRVEREHCCDDIAASTSGNPLSYARALTALEELRVLPSLVSSPALSALGGSLPERVRRLVASPASRCSSRWVAGASVLTLMSSLAVAAPVTALVLPVEVLHGLPAAPQAPSAAEKLTDPSVIAPLPTSAPAPMAAPSPVSAPSVAASPQATAHPSPGPHPNPNPHPNPHPRPNPHDDEDDVDEHTRVGEGPLSVDQLVALKVAGVSPEQVEMVKGLGYEPTVSTLIQFGHAGITAEYAEDMNSRFGKKLDADELVAMKHLGVTPDWIEVLKKLGFTNLSPDDLTAARAVGVDEDYLRGLKAAGYTGLSLEQLTQMRAVGVKPETIAELFKAGYGKLDADTLVQFQSLGISPGYIRSLSESGLKGLSPDDLVELRALGVDSDFVRQMHEAGLEKLDVESLVRLRSSGVDADFIRRMNQKK